MTLETMVTKLRNAILESLATPLQLYIAPHVGHFSEDIGSHDAATAIAQWLAEKSSCLLLLGDSGAGKTLFGQWLTQQHWLNYKEGDRLTFFIPLLAQKDPSSQLLARFLKKTYRLNPTEITWVKQQPLLLILDGFDEMPRKVNLYQSNALYQLDVKVLISCRSQALASLADYKRLFVPCNHNGQSLPQQLTERVMRPFDSQQIDAYLQQYVQRMRDRQGSIDGDVIHQVMSTEASIEPPDWYDWQTYQRYLKQMPSLQALITSPFALSMIVDILPGLIAKHQDKQSTAQLQWTRLDVFEQFVELWFARQAKKLRQANRIEADCPIEAAFKAYSQDLADTMLDAGVSSIHYQPQTSLVATTNLFQSGQQPTQASPWARYFDEKRLVNVGGYDIELGLIRFGCPLMQLGAHEYAFLHKSLLEYFAARQLFEGAMLGASIALGTELNEKLLIDEPAVLQFCADKVRHDTQLKAQLMDVIYESRHEEQVAIAAANAITILNLAGVALSGRDFKWIRITGADLRGATLDQTDLSHADMRGVRFMGAWLRGAKLTGSYLDDLQWGEYPYLSANGAVDSCAYSADGQWLAIGDSSGMITFYDCQGSAYRQHTRLQNWTGIRIDASAVSSLAFSPDSRTLAAVSNDEKCIYLWDVKFKRCLQTLKGHTSYVKCVAFSRNGKLLASGGWDNTLRLWDVSGGRCVKTLPGHTGYITSIAFSHDDQFLLSGSYDKTLKLWEVTSGRCTHTFSGHDNKVTCVAVSSDGGLFASGSHDKTLKLWDMHSKCCTRTFAGHVDEINCIAFSPDSQLLASGGRDGTLLLWSMDSGHCLTTLTGHTDGVISVVFHPRGEMLASGSKDKTLRLWTVNNEHNLNTLAGHTDTIYSVFLAGQVLASGGKDNSLRVWDVSNGRCLTALEGHTQPIQGVTISSDYTLLASASHDKTVRLWELGSGRCAHELAEHTHKVTSVAFSVDGQILASGSKDHTLKLWNVSTGHCIHTLTGHTDDVTCMVFSSDGLLLVSGSDDTTLRLWNVSSGQCVKILADHTDEVISVAFSPDGLQLVSASFKTLRVWDMNSGRCLKVLSGHTHYVRGMAFSPDGHWLISGSEDKTLRLWDVNSGRCSAVLDWFQSSINSLSWQDDTLVVACGQELLCFQWRNNTFYLQWRQQPALNLEQVDIHQVTGLSESNLALLQQRGAKGTVSIRQSQDIINNRRQALPFNPDKPPRNLFSNQFFIDEAQWGITMLCKKGNEHAFFILESVEQGLYITTRIDFLLDQRQPTSSLFLGHGQRGKGMIEMTPKGLLELGFGHEEKEARQQFFDKHQLPPQRTKIVLQTKAIEDIGRLLQQKYRYKVWPISAEQGLQLLANMETDRQQGISYLETGNSLLYAGLKKGQEQHSCLTWCEKQLTLIDIDVSQQQHWLDVVVAVTSKHLPDNTPLTGKDTRTSGKCLTM